MMKQRGTTLVLKPDEATAYAQLRQWAGRIDAARFTLAVLASRPVVAADPDPQQWLVPSQSKAGELHVTDIELRVCDCRGWRFKHHCSHLSIADRAARLRYQLLYGSTDDQTVLQASGNTQR